MSLRGRLSSSTWSSILISTSKRSKLLASWKSGIFAGLLQSMLKNNMSRCAPSQYVLKDVVGIGSASIARRFELPSIDWS